MDGQATGEGQSALGRSLQKPLRMSHPVGQQPDWHPKNFMIELQDKIRILSNPITVAELQAIAKERFGDMVKAVVDLDKKVMAIGGELHADEEAVLLDNGSQQRNLWGINIYVDQPRENWLEFDSMINIRPSQNNRSRTVENVTLQKKIIDVVNGLIK